MPVPDDIQKKADRRIYLWHKNKGLGLTRTEIEEYKKLTRSVNAFIKKTWPGSWEIAKRIAARQRIVFKVAPPKPKKKSAKTILKEKIIKLMEAKAKKVK